MLSGKFLLIVATALGSGFLLVSSRHGVTNCGGNSAALSKVGGIVSMARVEAENASDRRFVFTDLNEQNRTYLRSQLYDGWVRKVHLLASTQPLEASEKSRRVVVVCDVPYNNVPRHFFGKAPFAHAAGFADGTSGLISPVDFAAMDQASFVRLNELCPPVAKHAGSLKLLGVPNPPPGTPGLQP